ncbi:hypothetical protein CASFOL_030715 [Castilleja foliolosa]|uniref:Uncharacterized protein n=1 Tax=Castilleja foliolosa TaxID=1961234 RepID=A0ABD3C7F9_9LAMI
MATKVSRIVNIEELDDIVEVSVIYPKTQKRVFKGECSNSKSDEKIESLTFMCEICADEKHKNESFRILGCAHSYCSDCVEKYVASKLQDNIAAIKCPVSGCKGFLEPQHCISILPKQVFDRWTVILATDQKLYCPFKDKRSREDIMLMSLAKKMKWMRCPQCNIFVEKITGCFFITCRVWVQLLLQLWTSKCGSLPACLLSPNPEKIIASYLERTKSRISMAKERQLRQVFEFDVNITFEWFVGRGSIALLFDIME